MSSGEAAEQAATEERVVMGAFPPLTSSYGLAQRRRIDVAEDPS
jgi:hypothetical protein